MAISFQTQGTTPTATGTGTGSTSVSPDAPASVAVGNVVILFVGAKPDTATIDTPTDWTLIGTVAGGGGTTGNDAGPMRLSAYSRVRDGAWNGTTMPTVNITNGNSSWAQAFRFSNATGAWDIAAASGADSTTGTAWSVTCGSNPGLTAGDHVIVGSAIPTDVTTPAQFSAEAVSATGVSAWGTVTELSEPETTTNQDAGGFIFITSVTTGTSSAAPVVTATAGGTTTNVRGVSLLVRLRETAAPTIVSPATISRTASLAGSAATVFVATPPVPTGLQVTPVSGTQINLAWDNMGAYNYDIERDGVVIVQDHTTNSYSDTGLTAGVEYDYRVRTVAT